MTGLLEKPRAGRHTAGSLHRNLPMNCSLRLSLLALLALAPAVQAADLLVNNVNGYTLDSHGQLQHFQALLIDQGKVVATGDHAALSQSRRQCQGDRRPGAHPAARSDRRSRPRARTGLRTQQRRPHRHEIAGRGTGEGESVRRGAPRGEVDPRRRLEPGNLEAGPFSHGEGTRCRGRRPPGVVEPDRRSRRLGQHRGAEAGRCHQGQQGSQRRAYRA